MFSQGWLHDDIELLHPFDTSKQARRILGEHNTTEPRNIHKRIVGCEYIYKKKNDAFRRPMLCE